MTGTILQPFSVKSDRVSSAPILPHLWVTDLIAAQPLVNLKIFAEVFPGDPKVVPTDAQGEHILCLDPDTPELVWKAIAYGLIDQGCHVRVCQVGITNYQPLEWFLRDTDIPITDVWIQMMDMLVDWQDWVKSLDTRLDLLEALKLAELALVKLRGKQQSSELNRLRQRVAGSREMSEFTWGTEIDKLKADLERSYGLPASDRTNSSRYKKRFQAVKGLWDGRLRLNTLKQQVELDGEPLDLDFVRADLCVELDIDIPKEEANEIVLKLARENQYCPIVEYLEKVEATYPEPNINFANLTSQLLGTSDPLHTVYLKRHLIGSVARALNPGCKMDTALILQGEQGIGKSSFFRSLYGDEFFDDTMAESSDKDELMKLHQHWAVEWAEFETQLSRKGYSRLKQFMSTKVDNYRVPYARTPKAVKRRSVLVGSTNELEFLNDPSGDRRYWVIPLGDSMNLSLAEQLRDQIWAAAVAAYRAGEKWHLTPEEKQLADEANQPFRTSDTWEDYILAYAKDRQFVTIAEVLTKGLELDPSKQDKSSQMRASAILRRLGWDKGRIGSTRKWTWINPNQRFDQPDQPLSEVGQTETLDKSTFDQPDQPDPPPNQHLPEKVDALEPETEKSLDQGWSVDRVESLEACKTEVSPTDQPLIEVKVGQWVKFSDRVSAKDVIAQVTELANEHGLYSYRQSATGMELTGALYRNQFEPLSKDECLAMGLERTIKSAPYNGKTNLPKKGDRVRQYCGKEKAGLIVGVANRKYTIRWEGGQEVEHSFSDLQTLDIRKA